MGGSEEGVYYPTRTEEYNGTSWSAGGNLGTGRFGLAGGGNSSNAICMGGYASGGISGVTEGYNGTSWSFGGSLGTQRCDLAGGGSRTNAIAMGGHGNGTIATCEIYYEAVLRPPSCYVIFI